MAPYESPRLMSHSGYILKYDIIVEGNAEYLQCEVFELAQTSGVDNSNANLSNDSSYSWTKVRNLHLKLNNCISNVILKTRVCKDVLTGLNIPVVLLQNGKTIPSRFFYKCVQIWNCQNFDSTDRENDSNRPQFLTLSEFELDSDLSKLNSKDLHLLDGPSIIWIDQDMGTLIQMPCHEGPSKHAITTQICERTSLNDSYACRILWSGPTEGKEQYVVIGTKWVLSPFKSNSAHEENARKESENMEMFVASVQRKDNSYQWFNLHSMDASTILPHQYCPILTTILVEDIYICVEKGDKSQYKLSSCHSHIFASTSQRHLLEFRDGKLTTCVDIHSPSISTLLLVDSYGAETHLGLWSRDQGHFTGVRCHDLQIRFEKTDVGHVFVDDLIGFGAEQALLLSSAQVTWPPVSWTLTDFGPRHVESGNEKKSDAMLDHTDTNSSIQTAVDALQTRLQNDLIKLRDLEKDFMDRTILLHTACTAVRRLTLNQAPPITHETEFVKLCGSEIPGSENISPGRLYSEYNDSEWLEVKDTWQRLFDGQWVVGVDIVNMSQRKLSNLSLSASLPSHVGLVKEHQITKSFWPINKENTTGDNTNRDDDWIVRPSAAKRPKLDWQYSLVEENCGRRCLTARHQSSVLCVMTQPLFGVDSSDDLLLFLSFSVEGSEDLRCTAAKSNSTEPNQFTIYCGRVSFSVQDLFENRHCINLRDVQMKMPDTDRQRCLLAIDSCQLRVPLALLSTENLTDITGALTNITGALTDITGALTASGFTYSPLLNCYLCPAFIEHLKTVRIEVTEKMTNEIAINVYCRDKAQLWSVLHYLYQVFPDDVVMVSQSHSEADQFKLVHGCRRALHEELEYSISTLHEMLESQPQTSSKDRADLMDTDEKMEGSQPSMQTVRDEFVRTKQKMEVLRTDGFIPASQYIQFQKILQEKQQISDNRVYQLTSTKL